MSAPFALSYVLPLRWATEQHPDLTGYLHWLAANVEEVIVVDGSPGESFERHGIAWRRYVNHVPPDPALRFRNGKVNGVLTGLGLARHEKIVIADDDVRYERDGLQRIADHLDDAELVRPQNYFRPLPWHAAWDTARSLINRAFGSDFPGTLGVRRSVLLATGGYDGDVLFENLELIRTVQAAGGRVASPLDLYVERRPPDARHFWSQRVRQAYDDLAIPPRMALWLLLAPAAAAGARTCPVLPAAAAGAAIALADAGRRRGRGTAVFPFRSALAAPLWLAERSVTSWMALGARLLFGGVDYAGTRFKRAASSRASLERKHGGRASDSWTLMATSSSGRPGAARS
ncbi:MAG: glycosyltransferase family 2 protein [Actinomycetota bacterium]